MKIKSIFIRILCLVLVFSQISCVTKSLHERSYERDKVSGFYISSDDKMLAVIGEKYHYTFPLDSTLKGVLGWEGRSKIEARFTEFEKLSDQGVSGSYTLLVKTKDVADSQQNYLKELGFVQDKTVFRLVNSMAGKYYLAGDANYSSLFNKPYEIQLVKDSSIPEPVKIALTPITIAADGVLWIGGFVLVSLFCIGSGLVGKKCFPGGG